ncbi:MAG: acyl carrier protein [Magnetococcales bacterium]|nr:acyl carrier protein [Magnetococcales bacterium]
MEAEILRVLTGIMRRVFENDRIQVTPELTADDVVEWDSVGHMGLVLAVERAFAIRFDVGEIGRVNSVAKLLQVIGSKNPTIAA